MPLPPEIEVRDAPDGLHFLLPHRCPARIQSSRGCALGCGLPLAIVGVWITAGFLSQIGPTMRADGLTGLILAGLVMSPFWAFGLVLLGAALWLLLGARSELRLSPLKFRMRERLGPLTFSRRIPTSSIAAFRAKPVGPGLAALEIDLVGEGTRRWALEYPTAWIEALAGELARRKDALFRSGEPGPGHVERTPDGVRVTLPERGLWFAGKTFVVLSVIGITLACATLSVLTNAVLGGRDWNKFGPGLLVCGAGYAFFALQFYLAARQKAVFEYTGKVLRVSTITPLRRRSREWARSDVWGFEVVENDGRDSMEQVPPRPRLVARLSNGKKPVLLRDWDPHDLAWVISILRRGRNAPVGRPAEEPFRAEVVPSSGTCQVCSSPMEDNLVTCARCATPHHRECWDYTGMCSTYGCREIRVLGPRT